MRVVTALSDLVTALTIDSATTRSSIPPKPVAVKHLREWGLKFAGEDREDAEEFLEKLQDCLESSNISDRDLLCALPCILTKHAARWFRTIKKEATTWSRFQRLFKNRFVQVYDREDLLDDLKRRMQGKGEKITPYLASLKYIVSRFARPPREREIVDTAWRNLLPKYRKAMGDKLVDSLSLLEEYGRRWERRKDLDSRYVPPPPPEKMRGRSAAFEPSAKSEVVAVEAEDAGVAATTLGQGKVGGKNKNNSKQSSQAGSKQKSTQNNSEPSYKDASTKKKLPLKKTLDECSEDELVAALENMQRRTSGDKCGAPSSRQSPRPTQNINKQGGASSPRHATAPGRKGSAGECFKCGKKGHIISECPDITCFRCNQKGHTSRKCSNPPVSRPRNNLSAQCLVCGAEGTFLKDCPQCAGIHKWLGVLAAKHQEN